jgi:tetratricopeptide (TPR) repeat protein
MGSREEGIRSLQRAVALNSDSARAHFNLGMMLQQTDRVADALEQFEAALEAAPDYQAAARALQELRDRGAAPQPVADVEQQSAGVPPQPAHQSAQPDERVPVPPSPEESVEPGHGPVGCAVELAGSDSSEPVPGEWEDEHAFLHWWGDVLDRCARMGDPEGSAGAEHRGPFARLVGWCRRWRGMH